MIMWADPCREAISPKILSWLVVLKPPIWKIWVKIGSLPQVGVKIQNIWNHHPVRCTTIYDAWNPSEPQQKTTFGPKWWGFSHWWNHHGIPIRKEITKNQIQVNHCRYFDPQRFTVNWIGIPIKSSFSRRIQHPWRPKSLPQIHRVVPQIQESTMRRWTPAFRQGSKFSWRRDGFWLDSKVTHPPDLPEELFESMTIYYDINMFVRHASKICVHITSIIYPQISSYIHIRIHSHAFST